MHSTITNDLCAIADNLCTVTCDHPVVCLTATLSHYICSQVKVNEQQQQTVNVKEVEVHDAPGELAVSEECVSRMADNSTELNLWYMINYMCS